MNAKFRRTVLASAVLLSLGASSAALAGARPDLAIAGLKRLGVLDGWTESEYRSLTVHPLEADTMLPAPGQAVLVLETRADDVAAIDAVRFLHHPPTQAAAIAATRNGARANTSPKCGPTSD